MPKPRERQRDGPPSIRRATRADLPHIGRLGALLVAAHHEFDSRRFLAATTRTKDAYAAYLGSQLEEPDAAVLVAEVNPEVIGYAYVALESYDYMALRGPRACCTTSSSIPVTAARGIGRLLFDAALEFVRSRGFTQIVLGTAERNEAAQRFFASVGFRRTMIELTREL